MSNDDPEKRLAMLEKAMKALEDSTARFVALGLTKKGALQHVGKILELEFADDDFALDIEGRTAEQANKHLQAV